MQEMELRQLRDTHDEAFDFIVAATRSTPSGKQITPATRQLLHVLEVVSDQRDPSRQFPMAPAEVYRRMGPRKESVTFSKQRQAGGDAWVPRRDGPEEFKPEHLDADAFWAAVKAAEDAGVLEHEQRQPMTEDGNAITGSRLLHWWRLPVEGHDSHEEPAVVREDVRAVALAHRLSPVAFTAYVALRVEAGESDELLGCSARDLKRITGLDARTAWKHVDALQVEHAGGGCGIERATVIPLPRGRKDLDVRFCRPAEGLSETAFGPSDVKLHHSWPGQATPTASCPTPSAYDDPSLDVPFE